MRSEEGYSISCPGLPGCWSQGKTEAEALENIRSAIQEYLTAVKRKSLRDNKPERLRSPSSVPKIPGINHLRAVRALEKAGFQIVNQGKHVVMSDGRRLLTIPRHNPVNAYTMGGVVQDAGLTVQRFKDLL